MKPAPRKSKRSKTEPPRTLAELVAVSGISEKVRGASRIFNAAELKAALATHYGIGGR